MGREGIRKMEINGILYELPEPLRFNINEARGIYKISCRYADSNGFEHRKSLSFKNKDVNVVFNKVAKWYVDIISKYPKGRKISKDREVKRKTIILKNGRSIELPTRFYVNKEFTDYIVVKYSKSSNNEKVTGTLNINMSNIDNSYDICIERLTTNSMNKSNKCKELICRNLYEYNADNPEKHKFIYARIHNGKRYAKSILVRCYGSVEYCKKIMIEYANEMNKKLDDVNDSGVYYNKRRNRVLVHKTFKSTMISKVFVIINNDIELTMEHARAYLRERMIEIENR